MKLLLSDQFKNALISNEEAKTIFGGYGFNGPGSCNTPVCNQSEPHYAYPCGGAVYDGNGFKYYMGTPYSHQGPVPTSCKIAV